MTLNVNGIRDPIKGACLLPWLSQLSCDFVCLQETHVTDAAEATLWFSSSGFLAVTAPGTAHSRSQVLLYRPSFSIVNSWVELDGSLSSRIDLIGFPSIWLHLVSSCSIVPCPFSDHDAVFLGFFIPEPISRGPGRWKLNVSILKDPAFIKAFSDFWPRWRLRKRSFPPLQDSWDRGKEHLNSLAIRHCSNARNERSLLRSSVLSTLDCHLKGRVDDGVVSLIPVYERVLAQLASFDLAEALGARVCFGVKWAEDGGNLLAFLLEDGTEAGS